MFLQYLKTNTTKEDLCETAEKKLKEDKDKSWKCVWVVWAAAFTQSTVAKQKKQQAA